MLRRWWCTLISSFYDGGIYSIAPRVFSSPYTAPTQGRATLRVHLESETIISNRSESSTAVFWSWREMTTHRASMRQPQYPSCQTDWWPGLAAVATVAATAAAHWRVLTTQCNRLTGLIDINFNICFMETKGDDKTKIWDKTKSG